MELSALKGNEKIKEQLSQQERGRGLSHAYIISGPVGSGRHVLARLLAGGMLCTSKGEKPCGQCGPCLKVDKGIHPDLSVVTGPGEGKPITVDQIRALRSDAHIRPNEGERKVYLLEGADRMNPSAQNAMLKLLEEGPRYAAFLLLADNGGGLLETVRSRCEELVLSPAEHSGPVLPEEGAALVRELADALEGAGELELFQTAMALDSKRGREELSALLDALKKELGARAVRTEDRRRLLRAADLVDELRGAAKLNVNAGQLAGWLCAGMFSKDQTR
ncbi:DNA polymerase III subunit delta [bacterium 1xD42-67]|nr:DNA polymerase III subunit delta [bacterium 1xD42-67]